MHMVANINEKAATSLNKSPSKLLILATDISQQSPPEHSMVVL